MALAEAMVITALPVFLVGANRPYICPCASQIRTSIKSLFTDRDCVALVRPMNEETRLHDMDKLPLVQLRPEFRQVRSVLLLQSHDVH